MTINAASSRRSSGGGGTASEKMIANISAIATGAPFLPQAMPRNTTKVATTMKMPSSTGEVCSIWTQKNSGTPISGAGSICRNLPLRGPATSGGTALTTPTAAAAPAKEPSSRPTVAEISR